MPRTAFLFILFFSVFFVTSSFAQLISPPASAPSIVQQQIGLTNITIRYHRPGVKGRKIFGELLPYGQVWRTGANESTKISFDRDVRINNEVINKGTYALYTIPGERAWTWILNSDTTLWGSRNFSAKKNVLEYETKVSRLTERINSMELRWMNITHTSADLALEWENVRIKLPFKFITHQQMEANIEKTLSASATGSDYYKAARYYLDNGLDLVKAQKWMAKKMELDGHQHGYLHYQAVIEHQLGNREKAVEIMEKALKMAREAGNSHYIGMNERYLKNWKIKAASVKVEEVLEKSIRYHDPNGTWEKGSFQFSFHESRPTSYRLTDVVLNNSRQTFQLFQRSGKDQFLRYAGPEGCRHEFNGSKDIPEDIRKKYRLSCERSTMFKNYYSYLWGLPMKLRDPGAIIDPTVRLRNFFGQDLFEIKVTYEPEVGGDTWYFYFDQETFALSGYRFYHDESKNDGEYILLSGEAEVGGLKLPKKREWYTHRDRRYLGTDELVP